MNGILEKQLSFEQAPTVLRRLKGEGKRIVQCHGTFDLLHPGHIVHFEEARVMGDVLVVTITGEQYVNKGPGRPFFNDQLRVKALASLECVDYVVVVPFPAAVEAIECVRPDVYCKGKEYEDPEVDVTGNIHDDVATVRRLGGKVCHVGSVVFSSTRLLNRYFETFPPQVKEFCRKIASLYPPDKLRAAVNDFKALRVLIVGDIIFDRYTVLAVQGLTSKDRILSGRRLSEDTQPGGALAVFRHVREFTPNVRLVGLAGTEPWVDSALSEHIPPDADEVFRIPHFTTIVKQRFVEPLSEGKQLSKLFSVNWIDGRRPGADVQHAVRERLEVLVGDVDIVMVMDFGHGLMSEAVRRLVEEKSPFLALNCQTNSNNHGFNIITRQYRRADSFSLDQVELALACGKRECDYAAELARIKQALDSRYAWLTRGSVETIGLKGDEPPCVVSPFENRIVDTVGAGDAFTSVASLAAVSGLPLNVATFMGQLAGAQAVRIVGNSECIRKDRLLKGGEAMLAH